MADKLIFYQQSACCYCTATAFPQPTARLVGARSLFIPKNHRFNSWKPYFLAFQETMSINSWCFNSKMCHLTPKLTCLLRTDQTHFNMFSQSYQSQQMELVWNILSALYAKLWFNFQTPFSNREGNIFCRSRQLSRWFCLDRARPTLRLQVRSVHTACVAMVDVAKLYGPPYLINMLPAEILVISKLAGIAIFLSLVQPESR